MALILALETATLSCSVALFKDGELIQVVEEIADRFIHAEKLHVFIDKIFKDSAFSPKDLDAVAVSSGPGSYTGLRIGVSAAKGLAFSLKIPLIAINTLQAMASKARSSINVEGEFLLAPMLDAKRMEIYTAVFDENLNILEPVSATIVDNSFLEKYSQKKVFFFGDGAVKVREFISSYPKFELINDMEASATSFGSLAEFSFSKNDFVDVAYFEPFYLKDFLALTSRKDPLRN